ncbi:uncharacterized protein [Dysidea avara]|uniref:uncharacterized protein n=1 Tax=Dysidea avara TaxID=196820 RepID=UPI0033211A7D
MWTGYSKRQKMGNPKPLKETAEKSIVSNLGYMADSITSRFSCGGKLKLPPNSTVSLAYRAVILDDKGVEQCASVDKEVEVMWCEFPGIDQTAMSKLLDACTVASFGYKGESVIDRNYRYAFKLDPKDFMTTFQLCDTPILGEIGLINPNFGSLQAELYKLNIYAPGGFFKSHVDTPRSAQMFGSLVVCLPTQFSGGELVVRHQRKEIKYDWSSPASNPLNSLCWAAFYSDIEHEVLPVTKGYRVTLTYNLYYGDDLDRPKVDLTGNPFFRTLQAALSNPLFMREGGVLGFNTHYSYTFDLQWADVLGNTQLTVDKVEVVTKLQKFPIQQFINRSPTEQELTLKKVGITDTDIANILHNVSSLPNCSRLKGADYVIFNSAKSLGLPVHIKPLLRDIEPVRDVIDGGMLDICFHPYRGRNIFALRNSDDFKYQLDYDDSLQQLFILFRENLCHYRDKDITWCQQPQYNQPAAAIMCYGNDPLMEVWYQTAVIFIGIPNRSECRQQLVMQSEGGTGSSMEKKDNVETIFKDFEYIVYT